MVKTKAKCRQSYQNRTKITQCCNLQLSEHYFQLATNKLRRNRSEIFCLQCHFQVIATILKLWLLRGKTYIVCWRWMLFPALSFSSKLFSLIFVRRFHRSIEWTWIASAKEENKKKERKIAWKKVLWRFHYQLVFFYEMICM